MGVLVARIILVTLTLVLLFASMYMSVDNLLEAGYLWQRDYHSQETRQREWFIWLAAFSLTIGVITNHWLNPLHKGANTTSITVGDLAAILTGFLLIYLTVRLAVVWDSRLSPLVAGGTLTVAILTIHFGANSSLDKSILSLSHALELSFYTFLLYGLCALALWSLRDSSLPPFGRSTFASFVLSVGVIGYHEATSVSTRAGTGSSPLAIRTADIHLSSVGQAISAVAIILIVFNALLNRYLHRRQRMAAEGVAETLTQHQGLAFMLVPDEDSYVFTVCDGELLYKMGLSPDDILGRSIEAVVKPKSRAEEWRQYCQSAFSGQEVVFEAELRGIRFMTSIRAVRRAHRAVAVIGSSIETTSLQYTKRALSDVEQKYRLIVENTSDLILIISHRGKILFVSTSSDSLLGYSYLELRGTSIGAMLPEQDAYVVLRKFAGMRLRRSTDPITLEHHLYHKDGTLRDFESRCVPVYSSNRELDTVVVVGRDITERKQNEEMLRRSESLSVVGQLAAGMAHEIRNPLTSIRGFVQLLQSEQHENPYWPIILAETKQIEDIVSEFLALAKPQAEERKTLELLQLLYEVRTLMGSQAILKNTSIELSGSMQLTISGVPHQLKQVFTNIVKNAIEAIDDGGTIDIRILRRGPRAVVVISDTGSGIEPTLLNRLGEPFYSTKSKGTGLGLLVSRKIVEEHSGSLRISSTLGAGTTVEVEFPLELENKVVST